MMLSLKQRQIKPQAPVAPCILLGYCAWLQYVGQVFVFVYQLLMNM